LCGYADPLRYNIRMEILLALGIGVGLASVAGVRAFLPLVAVLSIVLLAGVGPAPFLLTQISNWLGLPVIVALVALLVLESALDKFTALERSLNWAMVPVRAVSGAAMFAIMVVDRDPSALLGPMSTFHGVTLPGGLSTLAPYLIAGVVIAGAVAVLKVLLRPPAKDGSSGVSTRFLSVVEDVVALVGVVVGGLIPFVPLFVVGFLLFFYYRVRKRRGRKYGGLRILGD
jgi:hypothetical protein